MAAATSIRALLPSFSPPLRTPHPHSDNLLCLKLSAACLPASQARRRILVAVPRAAGAEELSAPPAAAAAEPARLYVGNLPFTMTSADLAEAFSEAGTVNSVEVIYDRATERSRGFAFVTMATADEAREAIELFNGAQMGGRTVRVNFPEIPRGGEREVRARSFNAAAADNGAGMGKAYLDSTHKVYAGNLGWSVTSQGLKDAFAEQPGLLGAKVIYERDTGRSRGFGFLSFATEEDMQAAIQAMNGMELEGRPLRLSQAAGLPRNAAAASNARPSPGLSDMEEEVATEESNLHAAASS